MIRRILTSTVLTFLAACSPALLGQTDNFDQRLNRGCQDPASCEELVAAAELRYRDCAPNTVGKIRCSDARADLTQACMLRSRVEEARQKDEEQEQRRALDDAARRREEQYRQEQQRKDEEIAAKAKAAWLVLDLAGCGERGNPTACAQIERFITSHPQSAHVEEAARVLRTGREKIAEVERRVAEKALEEEQAPQRRTPQRPEQRPATQGEPEGPRVCCCDGTVSPTCTTVKRGCCSHHGGVCACQ